MLEKILNYLHVLPLVMIFFIMALKLCFKNPFGRSLLPLILLLTSVGVASGVNVHHDHHAIFSGCYICLGYAMILVGVALKIARDNSVNKQDTVVLAAKK